MSALKTGILVVVGAALAGGGYWYGTQRNAAPAGAGGAPNAQQAGNAGGAAKQGPGGGAGKAPGGGPVAVESGKVVSIEMPQIITAVGSLRSDESVTMRPEVAGRIIAIKFEEGQRVTKGQTLIQLDAAVNQAEVQQARTNLDLAKSKYERAVDLASRNFISGQARDESKSAYELAQASLALVEARIAKTEIKAPFSGIIGLRVVSIGDYVKEGADLVNLEAIDPIKIDFRVPENFLRDVKVGQTMKVALDAIPGKTYDGRIIAVNPLLDAAGRSVVVRAQVRNQDTTLRPGMFARINLLTQSKRNTMVVPEEALVPQGTDNFLFRIVDGKANRVKVETGQRRDARVEIISGIEKDDTIVTAGQARLREGTPVTSGGGKGAAAKGAPKDDKADASNAAGKAAAKN
jgi:membrane fusion protein (multidrug efflux system)